MPVSYRELNLALPLAAQNSAMAGALTLANVAENEDFKLNIQLWPFSIDPTLNRRGGSRCDVDLGFEPEQTVPARDPSVVYHWQKPGRPASWAPDEHYRFRLTRLEQGVKMFLGPKARLTVFMNDRQIYPFVSGSESLGGDVRPRSKRRAGAKSKRGKRRPAGRARR